MRAQFLWFAAASMVVLVVLIGVWGLIGERPPELAQDATDKVATVADQVLEEQLPTEQAVENTRVSAVDAAGESRPIPWIVEGVLASLTGRVEDHSGRAVEDVDVVLGPFGSRGDGQDRRARSTQDGSFRIDGLAVGVYTVVARTSDGRVGRAEWLLRESDNRHVVRVTERPAMSGLVVHVRGPRADRASIEVHGNAMPWSHRAFSGFARLESVVPGSVRLDGVIMRDGVILARSGHRVGMRVIETLHASSVQRVQEGIKAWPVTLAEPGVLKVRLAAGSAPCTGVVALPHRAEEAGVSWQAPMVDGAATLELPAGWFTLTGVDRREGVFEVKPSVDFVEIEAGEQRDVVVAVIAGASMTGVVRGPDGEPVEGASVRVRRWGERTGLERIEERLGVPVEGEQMFEFGEWTEAVTDSEGAYGVPALKDGAYLAVVESPGLERALQGPLSLTAEERVVDFRLDRGGAVIGLHPSSWYCLVFARDEGGVRRAAVIGADGRFMLTAAQPGWYTVYEIPRNASDGAWCELARIEVVAGRSSWLDLTEITMKEASVIRGRVVRGNSGVPGVQVSFQGSVATTREFGEFAVPAKREALGTAAALRLVVNGVHWFVPPPAGDDSVDLALGEHSVTVRTTDSKGQAADARLFLMGSDFAGLGGSGWRCGGPAVACAGSYELTHLFPGSYRVAAVFEGCAEPVEVGFEVPTGDPVVVSNPFDAKLEILVEDADGQAVPALPLDVYTGAERRWLSGLMTGATGRVSVPVMSGPFELSATPGRDVDRIVGDFVAKGSVEPGHTETVVVVVDRLR